MMKSIKGKVVTGVVTLGLLSGVGVAFANTDAGQQLQNWYNGQIGKSTSKLAADTTGYATSKAPALAREYNGIKTEAEKGIKDAQNAKTTLASDSITSAAQTHINKVNVQKEKIADYMDDQFDQIVTFANGVINQAGNEAYRIADHDLQKFTGQKGTKAQEEMTSELNNTKEQAKRDLQDAINSAKDTLQSQLDSETTAATNEIKTAIDDKITELRTMINNRVDELVEAQKQLIAAKAEELQKQAIAELDSVVDGI